MRYETAAAFRRALTDHLINRSRRNGLPVNRLQKQLTFERFLARATRDLDLNVPLPAAADLPDELQRAAELDVGDDFEG